MNSFFIFLFCSFWIFAYNWIEYRLNNPGQVKSSDYSCHNVAVTKWYVPQTKRSVFSLRHYHCIFRFKFVFLCFFTARCYASAVLAMALCPSVRLSVRLSVASRCTTKTAKRRITQTTPHDNPGTLVFWSQRSPRNSTGVTPYGGTKCRWGGSKSATFHK